jgi:hypothetical protein
MHLMIIQSLSLLILQVFFIFKCFEFKFDFYFNVSHRVLTCAQVLSVNFFKSFSNHLPTYQQRLLIFIETIRHT